MNNVAEKKDRVVVQLQNIIKAEGLEGIITLKVNGNEDGRKSNSANWYKEVALRKAGYTIKIEGDLCKVYKDGIEVASAPRGHLAEVTV